ncbi:bacteriocin biosynthesis docking scaffold, SagD family [Dermatophilus congolensis]|uniref:Bacteriocin biosynthesis docking scaffold, SagD family n=2 Tax=Dermatophilus congolensis TaxID=1863 RepID=A0A239VDU9_9MICO|nr:YcaO-like family protein [Dermatophilus congolensis]SNV19848.1 bacteriocin biosynthesis docking scaffold, SagD family [Dermatophilus congolensis]
MTNPNPWPLDSLVDEHTGIIRRVRTVLRPDRAPTSYTSMTAEVSDARRLGEWPADRVSLGTTFGDPQGAWIAAVAEACERYCGNHLPPNGDTLRRGTATELHNDGLHLTTPDTLPRHAPWQHQRPNFEYTPLTDTTPTLWTRCHIDHPDQPGRGTAGEIWAPASLVYLNWRLRRYRDLPRTHHLNYAGIATGQGFSDACDRALFEIMERDALELWWHLGYPAHGIDPDTIPGLHEAMSGTDLEYHVVAMPHDYAPAFAALVYDPQTGLYAAGFSAKPDPAEAARKSVLEAVHTWIYTLGTQHADGWVFQAVQAGLMASGLYLPHRTDARYLDDAGPHQQHVRDLGAHVQIWQDPRTHHLAQRFTNPALGTIPLTDIPPVSPAQLRRRLADNGHTVIVRDLTTPDVAPTGLAVARVLVPDMIPNTPAAFTYYGMPRFTTEAHRHGLPTPTPETLNLIPAPHM